MYIHIYQTRKYLELGTYNSIHDVDIRKKFFGLSNPKLRESVHVSLGEGSGKNLDMFLLRET